MNASNFLGAVSSPALETIRAAIDRAFLDKVQDRFSGIGLTPEILLIVGVTLGTALGLGLLVLLVNYFIRRSCKGFLPTGVVANPVEIAQMFDLAMAQRSKVELSFSRAEGHAQTVYCSLEDIKSGHLVLEITAKVEAGPQWIGRPVTCHTRIAAPKDPAHSNFYTFDTDIAGLTKQADGSFIVRVPLPVILRLQQKRIHLRLEPPMEYMLGLALWPEQLDKDAKPVREFKKWGKPSMLYSSTRKDQLRLANVSAGGLRLDVSRPAVRETGLEFQPGERYIVLAEIFDPEKQGKKRLWSLVRVQNRYEDYETKRLEIGVKFIGEGVIGGENKDLMQWRKVSEDGIDAVGNWVIKRHLEQYRRHGVT